MARLIHFLQEQFDKNKGTDDSVNEGGNLPCDGCPRSKKPCKTILAMRKYVESGQIDFNVFIEFLLKTVREKKAQDPMSPLNGNYFHLGSFPQFKSKVKLSRGKGWLVEDPSRPGWFKVNDEDEYFEPYTIKDYECTLNECDEVKKETDHEQA